MQRLKLSVNKLHKKSYSASGLVMTSSKKNNNNNSKHDADDGDDDDDDGLNPSSPAPTDTRPT